VIVVGDVTASYEVASVVVAGMIAGSGTLSDFIVVVDVVAGYKVAG
jgi:hypothetical protein